MNDAVFAASIDARLNPYAPSVLKPSDVAAPKMLARPLAIASFIINALRGRS